MKPWQLAQTGGLILSGSYQMDTCAGAGGLGCRQVGWPVTQQPPSTPYLNPTNTQTSTIPILINQQINSMGTDIDGFLLIFCLFPASHELGVRPGRGETYTNAFTRTLCEAIFAACAQP